MEDTIIRDKLQKIIDKVGDKPFVFYGKITFDNNSVETERFCFCDPKDTKTLVDNNRFDENIFYYVHTIKEVTMALCDSHFEDFTLLDIEDGFELVDIDKLS